MLKKHFNEVKIIGCNSFNNECALVATLNRFFALK